MNKAVSRDSNTIYPFYPYISSHIPIRSINIILAELLKPQEIMLLVCCTQYVNTFGKLSSGHRNGQGQFTFQSERRKMPKNIQTIVQLCSVHMLAMLMLKILQARLQQYVNQEHPDVQAGFRKGRRTRDQIASIQWIMEKARTFQKKHLLLLLLH